MNAFAGTLTKRPATESKPTRKSSHALACGTRALIISHFARVALIARFSRSTAPTTASCERVSWATAAPRKTSALQTQNDSSILSLGCLGREKSGSSAGRARGTNTDSRANLFNLRVIRSMDEPPVFLGDGRLSVRRFIHAEFSFFCELG